MTTDDDDLLTAFAGIDRTTADESLCGAVLDAQPLTRERWEELLRDAMKPRPPQPIILPPCPHCGAPVLRVRTTDSDGELVSYEWGTGKPHLCAVP